MGKSICPWILVGSTNTCGKSCIFEYCKIHRSRIRLLNPKPLPCRKCGVGNQSESILCPPCGGGPIKRKLIYAGRISRIRFDRVLIELLSINNLYLDK